MSTFAWVLIALNLTVTALALYWLRLVALEIANIYQEATSLCKSLSEVAKYSNAISARCNALSKRIDQIVATK